MRNKSVSFFLPVRKGSVRVKNKNTRPFAGMDGGLLENKLQQLCNTKNISEVIVSTNDEECLRIAEKFTKKDNRVKIDLRPDELCVDATDLQDLIKYVPTVTEEQHIIWGHVTTPLADAVEYDDALEVYLEQLKEGYDSLISVTAFKNFLLNEQVELINNTTSVPWPRTQDLATLYEINHVMFIAQRDVYLEQNNRIGKKPVLHVMDKIKSIDVDWEDDFKIAEIIYEKLFGV